MPRIMQPARIPSGEVPSVLGMTTVASPSANLIRGALVFAAAGLIDVCAADPTVIAGVALQDASSAPGYSAANNPATITGRANKVSVALANAITQFSAVLTSGSATLVTPAQSDVGVAYGVTAYAGVWTVDRAKTAGSARVTVVAIDLDNGVVIFKFLPANMQPL